MLCRAYAKVNLYLDILAKRPDGLHEMDMLMVSAALGDELTLTPADETTLAVQGDVPAEDNLVLRAHALLEQLAGKRLPCQMQLTKHIPVAAGLGGGSADAAAALLGLNRLFSLGFSQSFLAQNSRPLGADVPFCVLGGAMHATGDGSQLVSAAVGQNSWRLVIFRPCAGLSTGQVFSRFAIDKPYPRTDRSAALAALARADLPALRAACGNALAPAAMAQRPEIARAIEALYAAGAGYAAMSGSGPSVFGVFEDASAARAAAQAFGAIAVPLVPCGVEIFA